MASSPIAEKTHGEAVFQLDQLFLTENFSQRVSLRREGVGGQQRRIFMRFRIAGCLQKAARTSYRNHIHGCR